MATLVRPFSPAAEKTAHIPWYLWCSTLAVTSVTIGAHWDVSWHRSIGRDTFWTPAHLAIYLCGVLAGIACGYLIFSTTFRGSEEARAGAVRVLGFRGPLGAFLSAWGGIAMLTSAPFDNWWHNAYGLDVKIISPPHMVLAWGMMGIQIGAMLLALSAQNRAPAEDQKLYSMIHAYTAAILVTMIATVIQEYASVGNQMHGSLFYKVTAWAIPLFLVGLSRSSRLRWPATTITAIYSAITLIMSWILQLFPATPKLAPIYNPVTHMVPPAFPLLIIVPAVAVDLLMRKFGRGNDWRLSVAIGVTWVTVMVAVHWFWADFLLTPAARNFFIGADQWSYSDRVGDWRYRFWALDVDKTGKWSPLGFAKGIGFAMILGIVASRISLLLGNAMAKVKR